MAALETITDDKAAKGLRADIERLLAKAQKAVEGGADGGLEANLEIGQIRLNPASDEAMMSSIVDDVIAL